MKGVEYAVQELRRSQDPWMLLGDFDLEDPLTGALASDLAWSWDDAFQTETWLPATRSSGRRIDFGLGCGRHFPTSSEAAVEPFLIMLRCAVRWTSRNRLGTVAHPFGLFC